MIDDTGHLQARLALLVALRRLIDGESSVLASARTIAASAHTLDPEMEDELLCGFIGIASEGDHIVTPDFLHLWQPDLHPEKIREAQAFEASYRTDAVRDAVRLLARYALPN